MSLTLCFELVERRVAALEQCAAIHRRPDALRPAVEKPHTQRVFEIADRLPPIMERFSHQYPRVALRMEVIGRSPDNAELPSLHERRIDLAIFRLSTQLTDQKVMDELHVENLFNDQLVVAAGSHSRWARRRKIDLAELVEEPWILLSPNSWNYIELAKACRARGIDMPKTRLDTIFTAVRVSLLAAGPYIATFPSSSMRLFADRFPLIVLPVELPTRPWPVAVVTVKNRTLIRGALSRMCPRSCKVA
jgi:DNA-binding transcriptional LysR family regulator